MLLYYVELLSFSVLVSKNVENGPSERWKCLPWNRSYWVSKDQESFAYFKKANFPWWKIPLKKLKLKTKISRTLGGVLSLSKFAFLKSAKILEFLYPLILISRNEISPLRTVIFQIYWNKNRKKIEIVQNNKKAFSKIVLDLFWQTKIARSIVNLENHCTL